MDGLKYFVNKLWTSTMTIHPLTYLIFLIALGLLFLFAKWIIQRIRPQTISKNLVAAALTIFVGLPIIGLIMFLMVGLLLNNQPF